MIELGSKAVMKMVQSKEVDRSMHAQLVLEVKQLVDSCKSYITFGSISQNRTTSCWANFARASSRTMTWLGAGPPKVLELASDDCNSSLSE